MAKRPKTTAKRKPGRPAGTGRYGEMIRVLLEPATRKAVGVWKERSGSVSESEAARDLIKDSLTSKGLL